MGGELAGRLFGLEIRQAAIRRVHDIHQRVRKCLLLPLLVIELSTG